MDLVKTLASYGIGKRMFRRRRRTRAGALALYGGSGLLPALGWLAFRNRGWLRAKIHDLRGWVRGIDLGPSTQSSTQTATSRPSSASLS